VTVPARAVLALGVVAAILLPTTPVHADAVRDAQWQLGFLHIDQAHQQTQGDGVVVGLVDTGVDGAHQDLTGSVLSGTDLVNPGGDGRGDEDGHGTALAALIAAHGHGSAGILGIAPKASVLPVRARSGKFGVGDRDVAGVDWATQHGAKVLCLAFGGSRSPKLEQAIEQAQAADIVIVAAAGNQPLERRVSGPAEYPGVLAVGAVDQAGNHAAVSVTGKEIAISAPGQEVATAAPGNKYGKGTGTSEATAIIAGVAALVRAKYPQLSAAEVIHRITATAIDKGPPGRDEQYGFGIVDPVAALTANVPPLQASTAPTTAAPTPDGARPPVAKDKTTNRTALVVILALIGLILVAGAAGVIVVLTRSRRS